MCGIIYKKSFKPENKVGKAIRKAYYRQKNRGEDGFGMLAIKNGRVHFTRTLFEHQVLKALKDYNSTEVMFHHRIPTSTENSTKYNHPIMALNKNYSHNYYLIHNGIIWNRDEIKKQHNGMGLKYFTDIDNKYNDSECLLHELALVLEGVKEKSDFEARGSMAFVLLQTDKTNKPLGLYFGRNHSNPLRIMYDPQDALFLSSEGFGEEVETNYLHKFDYKTREITKEKFLFADYYSGGTGSYGRGTYGGTYGCGADYYGDDGYGTKFSREADNDKTTNLLLSSGDIKSYSQDQLQTILKTQPFKSMDYFTKQRDDFNTCIVAVSDDRAVSGEKIKYLNINQLSQILVIVNNRLDDIDERIKDFRRHGCTNDLARATICQNVQSWNRQLITNRVDVLTN